MRRPEGCQGIDAQKASHLPAFNLFSLSPSPAVHHLLYFVLVPWVSFPATQLQTGAASGV